MIETAQLAQPVVICQPQKFHHALECNVARLISTIVNKCLPSCEALFQALGDFFVEAARTECHRPVAEQAFFFLIVLEAENPRSGCQHT